MMKKFINAWSVHGGVDFPELFRRLSLYGFEGVELNIDADNSSAHSLTPDTSAAELEEIRALSEKYCVPVGSISTSLYGGSLGSPDAAVRESGKELLLCQLDFAAALGATAILVVPGGVGEVSMRQAYENCFEAISSLKSEIEAREIFVGLENVWNSFFLSPFDMARFVDSFESEYIGAYFDVGNVAVFSRPEDWIDILGKRIGRVHIKDFSGVRTLCRGEFVPLLAGAIDWKTVAPALKRAGYDGSLTAEVDIAREGTEYHYKSISDAIGVIIKLSEEDNVK